MKLNTTNIANILIVAVVMATLIITHNPLAILGLLLLRPFDVNEAAIEAGMADVQAIGEEGPEAGEYAGSGKLGFMN